MADVISDLRAHLIGLPSVAALTVDTVPDGTHWVHGLELPANRAALMPRKTVVLNIAGAGRGVGGYGATGYRGFGALLSYRIDVFCYGATPFEALALSRAVHAGLKFSQRTHFAEGSSLRSILVEVGPRSMRDEDTDWPVVIETFIVLAEEETIQAA